MARATNWDRWAAATGIGFVVLFIVAFLTIGDQPGVGDSASETVSFYADERSQILTGAVLFGLAGILFLWFIGSIGSALRDVGEPRLGAVAFGSGVTTVAIAYVQMILVAGLAFSIADGGDEGVVDAINDLSWATEIVVSFPVAALIAATGIAALRSRLFQDWYGWVSLGAAAIALLSGTTWAEDGFWSPDGAFTWISIVVFMLWVVLTSALLLRREPVAHRESAVSATPG